MDSVRPFGGKWWDPCNLWNAIWHVGQIKALPPFKTSLDYQILKFLFCFDCFDRSMTVRAYDAVCWYEALKVFPNTNTKAFNRCTGQAASLVKQITSDSEAMVRVIANI